LRPNNKPKMLKVGPKFFRALLTPSVNKAGLSWYIYICNPLGSTCHHIQTKANKSHKRQEKFESQVSLLLKGEFGSIYNIVFMANVTRKSAIENPPTQKKTFHWQHFTFEFHPNKKKAARERKRMYLT